MWLSELQVSSRNPLKMLSVSQTRPGWCKLLQSPGPCFLSFCSQLGEKKLQSRGSAGDTGALSTGDSSPIFIRRFLCNFYNYIISSPILCHLSLLGFHFLILKMIEINTKFPWNPQGYVSSGKWHADFRVLKTQSVGTIPSSTQDKASLHNKQ